MAGRRFTALTLVAAAAAAPLHAAPPPLPKDAEIEKMVAAVSAARIEARIRKLVSFETRNTLSETQSETRGIGAARRWIKAELEQCAADSGKRLTVEFDEHLAPVSARIPKPTPVVNMVATLPGARAEHRDRVFVVSGHYDSMRSTPVAADGLAPGANDDGSGTAVVMELACVMARHAFDATLVFMTVAGEEQGLLGATSYARAAKARGVNIEGMITNDIVGNSRAADGTVVNDRMRVFAEGVPPAREMSEETQLLVRTGGENDSGPRQLGRHVKAAQEAYVPGFKVDLIYRRDRYLRGGDHFPFLDLGYPALRFTEYVEDFRHQHQDVREENGVRYGDLPEFVDFAYAANVARVNLATLATLARAPAPPAEVQMENFFLENNTTLRWKAAADPRVTGYRVLWRDTAHPFWQHHQDVGRVERTTVVGVSKDNVVFGLQALDKAGNASVAVFPKPLRR
ncbi:MAG: M28 family peptidase [Betaproteobacteria bacterium]|nr:M28 family peptidase [Betaproteobacteria bacterium]